MQTVRRFLVLTPVALGVTTVAYLVYFVVGGGGSRILSGVGSALLVALVGAAVPLAAVLIAVGLLRPLGVRNVWAALGLALALVVVVLGINYAGIGDDEWAMLVLKVAAVVQVPTWLIFATGLLVGDLRNRGARSSTAQVSERRASPRD
ncbi:hypothetical protein ACFWEJ_00665 [Promicromonospora sp. NPDC060204]|uniref:hypothetical protein n=1 Tax=Promicromonospora sp. NPDC060204 TaxID=3347071 RepID=UPI003656EB77